MSAQPPVVYGGPADPRRIISLGVNPEDRGIGMVSSRRERQASRAEQLGAVVRISEMVMTGPHSHQQS
jgi:hypothetical protein